jgi:predicted dehydrogenase
MSARTLAPTLLAFAAVVLPACAPPPEANTTDDPGMVRLMTLDPGHFHAALVQKQMNDAVSTRVDIYAPASPDVVDHLARIEGFNTRAEDPTAWKSYLYEGDDYLERMLAEQPGNVVVISGRNRKKAEYIRRCAEAGLNVLADKPMCIDRDGYARLEQAFAAAAAQGVLVYDIMTERSEITTILQKALVHTPRLFGELQAGAIDEPAVVKESVHHFSKMVAGRPLKRPVWYFDTREQGEGIVDVTTHLVDLILWETFPGEIIDGERDVVLHDARRWPTAITLDQYRHVTQAEAFPPSLSDAIDDQGVLQCYANGQIDFTLRGIHARVVVRWNYEAPPGAGDTHYSIMRGTQADVIIRQGAEQNYRPELYVRPAEGADEATVGRELFKAIAALQSTYEGVGMHREGREWRITIPDRYRVGHEAHFAQVMDRYLDYLEAGALPDWEVPNMLVKYDITTRALEMAREEP